MTTASRLAVAALAPLLLGYSATLSAAQSVEDFYTGKTVTFLVGSSPGGAPDLYARTIGPYLRKYLPGQPVFITQNMWGAGGAKATRYFANVAPRDGTVLLLTLSGVPLNQILRAAGVDYDMAKFNWVGRLTDVETPLMTYHTSPVKTFADTRVHESIFTASGLGSSTFYYPKLASSLLGSKITIIRGYQGVANMVLAMERGEAHGLSMATDALSAVDREFRRKFNFLAVFHLKRLPSLPNVPTMGELATSERDRRIFEMVSIPNDLGRPVALPPRTPPDRVVAMREAFRKAVRDNEFLERIEKLRLVINYQPGEWVQETIKQLIETPDDIVRQTRLLIGLTDKKG